MWMRRWTLISRNRRPAEVWARHGVQHPPGADVSGVQDLIPQTIDKQTALSYTAKVPASLMKEVSRPGAPVIIPAVALIHRLALNPFVTKFFYPFLTRQRGADELLFLGLGYEEDPPMALPLAATDEPNRFPIQLYYRTATQADLRGTQVLEVSCGHGGGASYLARTLRPASYTGLDLNPAAIAFCRKTHNLPGLDFVHGDAENLPFADQSFDALVNIEASHGYPKFPRFLAEVVRVLRPGGHFLYADFRPRYRVAEWEAALADAPMRLLSQTAINAQVLRGMEKNSQRTQDLISRRLPAFLHGSAREFAQFAGVQGSRLYRALQSGEVSWLYRALKSGEFSYRMYSFAKD
jgi:ubiquinone/menaquinone biosynthesis C-methylase UbiE